MAAHVRLDGMRRKFSPTRSSYESMCHCKASHQFPHSFSAKFKPLAREKGSVTQ